MLYICNLGNYANMQLTKLAHGCQGGKQAEFSLISIKIMNQSKNIILVNFSRSLKFLHDYYG